MQRNPVIFTHLWPCSRWRIFNGPLNGPLNSPLSGLCRVVLAFAFCTQWQTVVLAAPLGNLNFRQESFVSKTENGVPQKQFQFFGAEVSNLEKPTRFDPFDTFLKGEISGQVSSQNSALSALNLGQLYVEVSRLSVGRRKWDWSKLDEQFHLGMFQPLYNVNPLSPRSQGLSGVFLNLETTAVEGGTPKGIMVMGSQLAIPDQQPGYEIRNGQFEPINPWFPALPKNAQFDEQGNLVDPIRYDLQTPDAQAILFQPVYAAQAYYGAREEGFRSTLSWANKPSHQFTLGTAGYSSPSGAVIPVRPQTYMHQLLGTDLGYRWENVGLNFSFLQERPSSPSFATNWTYNEFQSSQVYSPSVDFKLSDFGFQFAHMEVQGGEVKTVGPLANQFSRILPQRYPFRRAEFVQATWQQKWKRSQGIAVSLGSLFDPRGEYSMVETKVNYQFLARWALMVGGQLVSAEASAENTIFGRYRNNDYVQSGVSYAF